VTATTRSPTGTALQIGLVLIGLVVLVGTAWLIRDLLIQMFIALVLAAGLLAPVVALERRMPRAAAIAVVLLSVVAAVILILVLVVPPLVAQIGQFIQQLPELIEGFEAWLAGILGQDVVDSWTGGSTPEPPSLGNILALGADIFGLVFAAITTFIFVAMLLGTREQIGTWLASFLPGPERARGQALGAEAVEKLGGYVRGLLGTMTYEGVGVALGAWVLGLPMALALGGITFLAAAIPYIGTLLMVVPAFIIGLTVSPAAAVLIVVWIIILEQLEGLVVTPLIQSHAVKVSPLAVMFGVLAGFTIAGIVGGLLAIPVVALIQVVLNGIVFPLQAEKGIVKPATASAAAASAPAAAAPSPAPAAPEAEAEAEAEAKAGA
jgi:predicted PurR-regulated permease PerM